MELCSFMRRAELLAQQPVLSGAVVFGACVWGRVTTRLIQNVCSDNQGTCWEYQKALERQYNDICGRARAHKARTFMGETASRGGFKPDSVGGKMLLDSQVVRPAKD